MSSQLTPSITGAAGSPTVNPSISNPASENDDDVSSPSDFVVSRLRARNEISRGFFPRQCDLLAAACCEMARRFRAGGRLFAFGRDHHATDAQQVAVQYVQPPAGGRSPLPAFDLSLGFVQRVSAVLRPDDMLIRRAPSSARRASRSRTRGR